MDEVALLVNPASDNGRTGKTWPKIARKAAAAGLVGKTFFSERAGHVAVLAQEACSQGARLVVAVGGDGTVHEAVNGLMRVEPGERAELATLPRGTGRDFARSFGIPRDLDGALRVACEGATRAIDVGRASYVARSGSLEESYFVNFAGAGISGAVAARANSTSKALGGRLSFFWATTAVFMRWHNSELEVEIDDDRRSGRMLEVIAANGEYLAGGMRLTPQADPADGQLDVILIGDVTKLDFVRTLPKIYRGTHLPHPRVELIRGRRVRITAAAVLPITLDGEQPGTTPATFEILPRSLRLRIPATT